MTTLIYIYVYIYACCCCCFLDCLKCFEATDTDCCTLLYQYIALYTYAYIYIYIYIYNFKEIINCKHCNPGT